MPFSLVCVNRNGTRKYYALAICSTLMLKFMDETTLSSITIFEEVKRKKTFCLLSSNDF